MDDVRAGGEGNGLDQNESKSCEPQKRTPIGILKEKGQGRQEGKKTSYLDSEGGKKNNQVSRPHPKKRKPECSALLKIKKQEGRKER